jgi:hypothetical protein
MMRPLAAVLGLTTLLGAVGCAQTPKVVKPPGIPPTPKTVTLENPGGDADDPELAALNRLIKEPWGWKRDRFDTLRVPLLDWRYWQRVKIFGHPTRGAYKYGDEHYAVGALWYTPIEGDNDPDRCLAKFLEGATPEAAAYGIRVGESRVVHSEQRIDGERRPVTIKVMDGAVESIIDSNEYVGAVASYQSWPGTCLIFGFAVVSTHHRELALKVRERWVAEGAPGLVWEKKLTEGPTTEAR